MITAYFDESGTHQNSKVLIVCAYVGNLSVWESIENRFKRADKHAGIPFHAVDCAGGGKKYRGMDKDKRNRISKKMIRVITDHDIYGSVWGAWIDDYEAYHPRNGERWEKWLGPLYTLLFQGVIIDIAVHIEKKYRGENFRR